MDDHDDDQDVEGVKKPVVNHFVVGSVRDHLVDGGLDGRHHHHGGDGDHDSVLSGIF